MGSDQFLLRPLAEQLPTVFHPLYLFFTAGERHLTSMSAHFLCSPSQDQFRLSVALGNRHQYTRLRKVKTERSRLVFLYTTNKLIDQPGESSH